VQLPQRWGRFFDTRGGVLGHPAWNQYWPSALARQGRPPGKGSSPWNQASACPRAGAVSLANPDVLSLACNSRRHTKISPARTPKTAILLRSSSDFASGVEGESRQAGDDFQDRSKMLVDDGARADLVMRDQRIEQLPVLGKDDAEALRI
jgi:hypothetical protein